MKIPFRKSIFVKIILIVSGSFLVVISISFIYLFASVRRSLTERTDAEKLRRFYQMEHDIDAFCKEIEMISERMINMTPLTNLIFLGDHSREDEIVLEVSYFQEVDKLVLEYDYIESICFFNSEELSLIVEPKQNLVRRGIDERGEFYEEQLADIQSGMVKENRWYGRYTSEDFNVHYLDDRESIHYVTFCRPVYWGRHMAWLIINVNQEKFTSIYNFYESSEKGQVITYIIDEQGIVISSLNAALLGEKKERGAVQEKQLRIFEENGQQILYYPLNMGNWILVEETPLSIILKGIQDIRIAFLVVVGATIAVLALFLISWISLFSRSFTDIVGALGQMEAGELGITIPVKKERQDEIGLLIRQFNRMSEKIGDLINENRKMEQKKREAEIKMLRSQMNPHFLYNTLNTVKWMAAIKGEDDIVDCVTALGNLLQPLYRDTRTFWRMEKEIDYITSYGKIMNYRYGGNTVLRIEIEKEVYSTDIPKYILQPIVENAFLYGSNGTEDHTIIRICGKRLENAIQIQVEDNGGGMDEQELEKLKRNMDTDMDTGHIGLANVAQRLKALYDGQSQIRVESKKGEGFSVLFIVPWHQS